jgi:hypothetical protein
LLSKYLRERYADRVVLTFTQIEDLLGFPLPERAHYEPEWWDAGDGVTPPSAQSTAWILAHRTATVNLPARHVVFDRELTR